MIKFYAKVLLLFFVCGITANSLFAQNGLSERVTKARNSGAYFQTVTLFSPLNGDKHPDVLRNESLLTAINGNAKELYEAKYAAISIVFKTHTGAEYKLDMIQSHPVSDNFNFGYIAGNIRGRAGYDAGLHYQGIVSGVQQSLAALSVFANGDIMVLFANDEGNFTIGKLADGSGRYILYNDKDFINPPAMKCGTKELPVSGRTSGVSGQKTTKAYGCNKVQVYWEVDYDMYAYNSSSLSNTQTYMTGLFNQFQAMYNNEKIAVELKSLYIWTSQDGYPFNTSSDGLDIFKGYWNNMGDNFDGDIAHFITKDNSANGGLAYLDVLCNKTWAYAYSEIHSTYNVVPTYSWDVMVLTHETGHNLGSNHTHWCGWMTGSGGSCGSIDNCTTQEGISGCSTCPKTYDNALPSGSWSGTVMSYCHLVSRGINLANGFGPLPGNKIRTQVSNASCLKSIFSAKLTPTSICNADGAVTLTYNPNNFGASPYTYSWSGGATSQNLSGLSTQATYSVTITDSNGCSNQYSADVMKYANPGDANSTGYTLPVCCHKGPVTVTLTAKLPTSLGTCQTVAWLRTTSAITTYSAAQAAYAAAAPADIIASTNSASVSNSTAATLNVTSPTPCASQSYYYTPFVTRKAKSANSITSTVNSGSIFYMTNASTAIGYYVGLSDQTTSLAACDILDTPVTKTLTATVSAYTGRANNLTIVVEDAAGNVIYRKTGLAGNGTYSIPVISTIDNPLQALNVSAFDFNCSNSSTCVASSLSLSVTRSVVYASIPANTFAPVCAVGKSVQLGFAPENCQPPTNLEQQEYQNGYFSVYPNPASKAAVIKFYAAANGTADLKITDMLGKTILSQRFACKQGDNELSIDVRNWVKGVYFISLPLEKAYKNVKFIVE